MNPDPPRTIPDPPLPAAAHSKWSKKSAHKRFCRKRLEKQTWKPEQWLVHWLDEQIDPSVMNLESATAALESHRVAAASASTSAMLNKAQLGAPLSPPPPSVEA